MNSIMSPHDQTTYLLQVKIVHTVSGRKFPLAEICKDPLQRMHKLGLLQGTYDMTETEASKFAERRGRYMGEVMTKHRPH